MPSNLQLPDLLTPGSAAYLRKKQPLTGSPPAPQPQPVQPAYRQPGKPLPPTPGQPSGAHAPATASTPPTPAAPGKPPASSAPAAPAPPVAATVPQPAPKTIPPAAPPAATNPAPQPTTAAASTPALKPQPPAAPPAAQPPASNPPNTPTAQPRKPPAQATTPPTPAAAKPTTPPPPSAPVTPPPKVPSRADAATAMRDAAAKNAAAENPQSTSQVPAEQPQPPPPKTRAEAATEMRNAVEQQRAAAQLDTARNSGAVIENDKLIPHPDGKGGLLHHTGFVLIPDAKDPAKAPTIPYRDTPEKGTAIPYRDDHGKQHTIPLQDIRRVTAPDGKVQYHFMVDGKPVSVPEGPTPIFQIAPDGRRFITAADGTRRDLDYDRNAAAQAGITPREEAANKALQEKLAQGAALKHQLTEKQAQATAAQQRLTDAQKAVADADQSTAPDSLTQRIHAREVRDRAEATLKQQQQEVQTLQKQHDAHYSALAHEQRARQAEIGLRKTAAAESPADAQWQKDAHSAHGNTRITNLSLIAEAEKKDPASAAAMRQALVPQSAQRLFAAAEKSFGSTQPGQPPAGKSISLHEMLMQAPEMTQGQGTRQTTVNQAAAARTTAQNSLGIADPENVRVTRSADGSYSLSRPAADGSGTHQPFATLDPKTNRITLTPGPDGQFSQAAANLAASGSPDGTPIYLPGTQPPYSEAQVSDLFKKGLAATTSTTDRKAADAALTQAGLTPEGISQLVQQGRISVQDGQLLNNKFNSGVASYAQRDQAAAARQQDASLQQMQQDAKGTPDKPNFQSWLDKGDPQRDAQVQAKAKEMGVSEDQVRRDLETRRIMDWSAQLTQQSHDAQSGIVNGFMRGIGIGGAAESTRTLPDGSIMPNPTLGADRAKFDEAIASANGTPEAKAKARELWDQYHDNYLTNLRPALETMETLPGIENYTAWRGRMLDEGKINDLTENQKAEKYMAEQKDRSWLTKIADTVSSNLIAGSHDLVSGIVGTAGLLTGSQTLSEFAAEKAGQASRSTAALQYTGSDGLLHNVIGGLSRAAPGLAAAAATGGAAGGTAMAFVQGAGTTYADLYQDGINKGLKPEEAHKAAAGTAIASGAVSAALGKIMPGGAQALNNPATRKAFSTAVKSFLKGAKDEVKEEVIDGAFNHIATEMHKGKTFQQAATSYAEQFPQSALTAALLGGGVQATADHRQGGDKTPQQPAPVNPPAPSPQQPIPQPTTQSPPTSGSGQQSPTTANNRQQQQPPPTPNSPPPGIPQTTTQTAGTEKPADSAQPPQTSTAEPSTPPLSVEQSQKLIENVSKMPAKAQQHPTTQANVAQAKKVVAEEAVRSLEQKAQQNGGKLEAAESQALQKAKAEAGHTDANAPPANTEAGYANANALRPNTETGHADAEAGNDVRDRQPSESARNTPEPADTSTGTRTSTDTSNTHPSISPDTPPQNQPSGAERSRDGSAADPSRSSIPATTTRPESDPAQPKAAAGIEGRSPTPPDSSTNDGAAPRTASTDQPSQTTPTAPRGPGEAGSPGQPSSPSPTSLPPPRTPPLSVEQSRKLIENVAKMPEKAQQHPQVQADVAQARSVVAGDAARSPSPQSTPGLGVTEHALHSEQGQGGSPKQNAGSWQKGTGKADITAVPLTKEQWAARPEFKPDPNPIQAEDLMAWSPEHPVSPEMKSNIMTGAQGLLDLLPRDIAQNLGKVRLSVVSSLGKNVAGKYDPSSNSLILSADQIRNFTPEQLRKTMWHEMSHWLYHKAGSASAHESLKKWRSAIEEHWNKRTKGKSKEWNEEKTWQYINSDWISDYAGRFYGQVGGLELPSVYIEAASWGPGRLAKLANKFSRSQETFEIILSILKK